MAKPQKKARLLIKSNENAAISFLKKNSLFIESAEFALIIFFAVQYLNQRIRYQQATANAAEYEAVFSQVQAQIAAVVQALNNLFSSVRACLSRE